MWAQSVMLGYVGGVLWGSKAKAGLVNSNQKEWDFGKLHRGLIQGAPSGRPWEAVETR